MRMRKAAGAAGPAGVASNGTKKTFSRPNANLTLILFTILTPAAVILATAAPFAPAHAQTAPTYGVYTPPAGFQTSDAGEPSIGSNWKTGSVFFQSSLQTMGVRFDDRSEEQTL